jgi:hypothetical protein
MVLPVGHDLPREPLNERNIRVLSVHAVY